MALYTYDNKDVTKEDFSRALIGLGVTEGDAIFVHSDIKPFGKITASKEEVLGSLIEVIRESVGEEGTVIMPTFTYSFCKDEVYDPRLTSSTVGALTDFFWKQSGVTRSVHPIFSVAVWGKGQQEFLHTSHDSFGAGTVFETFHKENGKILLFGTDFQSCTFLHYVEQALHVPYRYLKTFRGTIVEGDQRYIDEFTYFVRPLDGTIDNDFRVIEPVLRERGVLREAKVGGGGLLLVTARDLFDTSKEILQANPYFFVKKTHD